MDAGEDQEQCAKASCIAGYSRRIVSLNCWLLILACWTRIQSGTIFPMMEPHRGAAPELHQGHEMVPIKTLVAVADQSNGAFACSAFFPRRIGLAPLCVSS
jgi:hypothetical protein